MAPHIGVEHLADLAPDLVEVRAVIIRYETAKVAANSRCFERKKERDYEHEQ